MKKKKGFTLVELLVVIAILAVLATVSVVGYMGFTKKAHESNDIGLTAQMNTILQAEEVTNKPTTPHDAVKQLANGGVDVEKLTPTTDGYNYVYDLDTNRMFLLDDNRAVVAPTNIEYTVDLNVFAFVGSESEITNWNGYSVYLKSNFEMTSENLFADLKTGLDVGNNTIESITYTGSSSKEALIRTNGGTLTINAGEDSVYHYGNSGKIVITNVADKSFHENGIVIGNVEIKKGRLVVEKNANINTILVESELENDVKIDVSQDAQVNLIAPTTDAAKNYIKNDADLPDSKTTIKTSVNDSFAGGIGSKESPYLISTKEQAMEIENNKGYFKLIADMTIEDEIYMSGKTYVIDLNGHTIRLKYGENIKPNNGSVLYIGGKKGNLTINDSSKEKTGSVISSDKNYTNKVTSAVRVGNYGRLTINGGNFYGASHETSCIFVYTSRTSGSKATVVINGGYFETTDSSDGKYYVLNHQDSATAGCTMTVNGGTFVNYNPGVTVVDPDNVNTGKISLGKGCTTKEEIKNGKTYYTVVKSN